MTVLSAQSIRRLCSLEVRHMMITPFVEGGISDGKSYGLGPCTYDFRIGEDLTLWPADAKLTHTLENVWLPDNVCGSLLDKSSFARIFVSAFNTHFDPGFHGNPTIELVNLGVNKVFIPKGAPLCQMKFEWLDFPTERPYQGKYQNQEYGPQAARVSK